MEDLAYLVPDSFAAWLGGQGDGRFRVYEQYYQRELAVRKSNFDLEKVNEQFGQAGTRPPQVPISRLLGKAAVGLFAIYAVSLVLKAASHINPAASGVVVIGILIGLRKIRKKKEQTKQDK
ncbi:hypothetical protein R70199_07008 [Paraburkholderia domus]|nr:hypothetical protein R70199_07008 [Paraburkholderia domus]